VVLSKLGPGERVQVLAERAQKLAAFCAATYPEENRQLILG
jgi:hypothetical protein